MPIAPPTPQPAAQPAVAAKSGGIRSDLRLLRECLEQAGLTPGAFLLPAALSFFVGVFEALSVSLLVPLTKGLMAADFSFVRELGWFRALATVLPPGLAAPQTHIFGALILLIFAVVLAKNVLIYASTVSVLYLVRRFSNNMRKLLVERCLSFGKLYFDRTSIGHLHTVIVNATDRVALRVKDFQLIFTDSFNSIVYLAMMCYISVKLTLLVIVVFPLLSFYLNRMIERLRATSHAFADAQARLSRRVFNVLSCLPLVKSYSMESRELESFARNSDEMEAFEFSMDRRVVLVVPAQEIIQMAVILALVVAMATIVAKSGTARIPGFLVFFYILRRAATSFGIMSQFRATLAAAHGPMSELLALLDGRDKFVVPEGTTRFRGLRSRIEFSGLGYSYGNGVPALKDVSFSIEKGRMTAIVGPSGAGKTTLVSLMVRAYDCPPGSIFIDGTDIRSFTQKSLADHVALVSQDTMLFNDTLRANITYGLNAQMDDRRLAEVARKARIFDLIAKLPRGIDTLIGDRGVQLSGGEKQRVSIARAMLKGAEILILDEATSSLDSNTERLIQEAIDEMIAGKTAIIIAHRLSTIKKADKIVAIENGRIVEEGPLAGLLSRKGYFHKYWEDQKFS